MLAGIAWVNVYSQSDVSKVRAADKGSGFKLYVVSVGASRHWAADAS
jgi:hypothetical protein